MDKKKISSKTIITIISFIFILFFRLIPAPEGLTELSMQTIGLFIGMMLLWNFVGVDWTSFLCMALLAVFEIMKPSAIFSSGIGNSTISFLLTFFMISHTLSKIGFSKRLAIKFITNPIAKKGPWAFVIMFLFSSVILSSFMSQTAALMIFIQIAEQIFKELGHKKGDRFPQMIILGLAFAVGIGSANTPIGHAIVLIPLQFLTRDTGINISIINYSIFGTITGLFIFAGMIIMYRIFYRPDLSPLKNFDVDSLSRDLKPFSKQEKISAVIFVGVIAVWLLQSILVNVNNPAIKAVGSYLNGLGTAIPTLIGVVLMCIIKIDGKPIMDFKDSAANGVPWSGLIFNAAVLVLSAALVLEEVGISEYLISTITPIVSGMSPMLFILTVVGLCTFLTNFASNTVCATVFYIIAAPIAIAMGNVNIVALAAMIGAAASYAFATPPATMPTAVVAGTGWVDVKVMFKYGMPLAFVSIAALILIGYPVASAIL